MSRPATTKLKVNAIVGSLPVLQYCTPEQLLIDESYQRSIEHEGSQSLIRKIAVYWDWAKCQPLAVSRRPDGGLYVVDGQHRLAASRLRDDIHQLPCVVTSFDSAEQEAAMFVALNQQRRPLNALELFKAAVAANDFEACQIVQCVKDAGLRIASSSNLVTAKPGGITNIGGLQQCYRQHGVLTLTTALKVLASAYPQQVLRYAGSIFPGIVAVVADETRLRADLVELVGKLGAFIGEKQQHDWYRSFALAIADDPNLKRSQASIAVLRKAWRPPAVQAAAPVADDYSSRAPSQPAALNTSTTLQTFLKPAEVAWCEQCDQRVSGAKASRCTSRFCSLKEQQAA